MSKTLYLDCSSGISGDMFVASLLDLGGDEAMLCEVLKSLELPEFHIHISKKKSYAIAGTDFDVHVHGEHSHSHEHHHEHTHEHHAHEHAPHKHRHLKEVFSFIEKAKMPDAAKNLSKKIFDIIAESEACVHGVSKEEVHFHEVGAVDSIVDIIAASFLYTNFGFTDCVVTSLAEGSGHVNTQHGLLPIPVPAVLKIAEQNNIALSTSNVKGEMVTPTGIGIVAAIRTSETLPEKFKILKSGIGLGKRDFGKANFLRAMQIEETSKNPSDTMYVIETNIDDATGEELGYAMEKLFEAGARDVSFSPCQMKKNRPGHLIRAIVKENDFEKVEEVFFKHTSTIGFRYFPVERKCLSREKFMADTPYGKIEIKKSEGKGIVKYHAEFDSVKKIADEHHVSIRDILKDISR